MARAAINILGDGSIIDITSLGKNDFGVDHPGLGQYLIHGTLGMCPPPEGWGYVINQMDADASVATSYEGGVLMVSVAKEGEPADLLHSITLHVSVEDLPLPELPTIQEPEPADLEALAHAEIAQRRAVVDSAIAPLQDAADLQMATEQEAALLKDWKLYRVTLNRLPDQPGFPNEIDWPMPPA
ncbi:MAG TPA: phage tail protein [Pseudomonas sp.]|nr:phage tail protein [Pseudomonas sp.]